jgi:hypothetical protein|tara:strand:+ start:4212 stop:4559 length:348 start_codon:yes stop_codon:yes gene_type:complete
MKPTWTEERAELAIWLRSYTGTITEWLKVFLEDPDHPVSKTKMLGQLDEWITRLEQYRERIMLMRSDPPEEKTIQSDQPDDIIPDLFSKGDSLDEQTEQSEETLPEHHTKNSGEV